MARLFTAGGEEGSIGGLATMATLSVPTGTNIKVVTQLNNDNVVPRTGDYCYGFYAGDGITIPLPVVSDIYMGFALYIPTITSGNYASFVNMNTSSGYLRVVNGTITAVQNSTVRATASMLFNQWVYMEIYYKPDPSTGRWIVKLNGTTVIDFTGNTGNAGNVGPINLQGHNSTGNLQYIYYDDIVINSSAGLAPNNTFPGQVRLYPLRVRGAGDLQQWTRKGIDLGFNHGQVREAGNGTSWLEDTTPGHYDLEYVDAPILPAGAVVVQVVEHVIARASAGGLSISGVAKNGGAIADGTPTSIGTAWQCVQQIFPITDVSSLQLGIKVS